jgi:hypothetical protein
MKWNSDESGPEMEMPVLLVELDPINTKKMLPMAMMKAKRNGRLVEESGRIIFNTSSEEKKLHTQIELEKLAEK